MCVRVCGVYVCVLLTSVRHVYTRVRVFAVDAQLSQFIALIKRFFATL